MSQVVVWSFVALCNHSEWWMASSVHLFKSYSPTSHLCVKHVRARRPGTLFTGKKDMNSTPWSCVTCWLKWDIYAWLFSNHTNHTTQAKSFYEFYEYLNKMQTCKIAFYCFLLPVMYFISRNQKITREIARVGRVEHQWDWVTGQFGWMKRVE